MNKLRVLLGALLLCLAIGALSIGISFAEDEWSTKDADGNEKWVEIYFTYNTTDEIRDYLNLRYKSASKAESFKKGLSSVTWNPYINDKNKGVSKTVFEYASTSGISLTKSGAQMYDYGAYNRSIGYDSDAYNMWGVLVFQAERVYLSVYPETRLFQTVALSDSNQAVQLIKQINFGLNYLKAIYSGNPQIANATGVKIYYSFADGKRLIYTTSGEEGLDNFQEYFDSTSLMDIFTNMNNVPKLEDTLTHKQISTIRDMIRVLKAVCWILDIIGLLFSIGLLGFPIGERVQAEAKRKLFEFFVVGFIIMFSVTIGGLVYDIFTSVNF